MLDEGTAPRTHVEHHAGQLPAGGGDGLVSRPLAVFEYEVWSSTFDDLHAGRTVTDVRKYLVAAVDEWEGYRVALDVAWRGDAQVTKVWWVP